MMSQEAEVLMTPATPFGMAEAEREAARMVSVFTDAFLAFPVAENFDLLAQRLRNYQTAWMNGRTRP
jgi:hypothetical protein